MTTLARWANPVTGERQKPPRAGAYLIASEGEYNDSAWEGIRTRFGGHIVDESLTADGLQAWRVVEAYRGKCVFLTLNEMQVDWASYTGMVRLRAVHSVAAALNREMAAAGGRNKPEHLMALLALSQAEDER